MFKLFKRKGPLNDKATRRILKSLFWPDSALITSGWFESVRQGLPVDQQGNPIPWWTYSSIAFLEKRLGSEMRVFEFGSGHSTLWLSRRVRGVVSCEHDREWFDRVKLRVPGNVDYRLNQAVDSGDYAREILAIGDTVDVVVIDGRDRNGCAKHTLERLKPEGVIIWDNAERADYADGFELLRRAGFKRIDFRGMGPINVYESCTAVYYRPANCLGI